MAWYPLGEGRHENLIKLHPTLGICEGESLLVWGGSGWVTLPENLDETLPEGQDCHTET